MASPQKDKPLEPQKKGILLVQHHKEQKGYLPHEGGCRKEQVRGNRPLMGTRGPASLVEQGQRCPQQSTKACVIAFAEQHWHRCTW